MNIILGSGSPRRKHLLKEMGYSFEVLVSDVDESFDNSIDVYKVAPLLARRKAKYLMKNLQEKALLICCDTVVIFGNEILGKPKDKKEAFDTISRLSGNTHEVMSAICLVHGNQISEFQETTEIIFNELKSNEIQYYVDEMKPFDKAGSYGIQEWIGQAYIKRIEGNYNSVVGLDTAALVHMLEPYLK